MNKKILFGKLLDSKIFTLSDQNKFAKFSGDFNPAHISPIYARRTIAGECIVHGVQGLLWGLNQLTKKIGLVIESFEVKFLKFIPLNVLIDCYYCEKKKSLFITTRNILLINIYIVPGKINKVDLVRIKSAKALKYPKKLTRSKYNSYKRYRIIYRGDFNLGKELFPELTIVYGDSRVIELAITSEIIGMQIPGLNSLFLEIKGSFFDTAYKQKSFFKIKEFSKRFGIVKLLFQGKYLKCEMVSFFRTSFKNIFNTKNFFKSSSPNNFTNINALIIGGSRGLGELTAKLIVSGGGKVTITYNQGKDDALKLKKDLLRLGLKCDTYQLNINKKYQLPKGNFNQVYYFATPKIKIDDEDISELKLIDIYRLFYVKSFRVLLKKLLKINNKYVVFYPSTNFIGTSSKEFSIYTKAKLEGEAVCKEFTNKNMRIIYERLPRLPTDQTLRILPELFQDPKGVMLSIIKKCKFLL